MRLVPVALVLVVLVGLAPAAALTPVAAADVPTHSSDVRQSVVGAAQQTQSANATLSGTVTYTNGTAASDAVVLVGSRAFFEKTPPSELRDIASGDPQDVTIAETDSNGSYSLTVGENVEPEAVVALSPSGVSRIYPFEGGEQNLSLRATKTLTAQLNDANTEPGGRTIVGVELRNTDDTAVEDLRISFGRLPEGWNVVSANSESGTFTESNQTFTWDAVEPGETVRAEVRIFVAIDANRTTHQIPVFADSRTHSIDAGNLSVGVAYPGDGPSDTAVDEGNSDVEIPGFGPLAALLALAAVVVAALVAVRREAGR
jgi:hypothetical protein